MKKDILSTLCLWLLLLSSRVEGQRESMTSDIEDEPDGIDTEASMSTTDAEASIPAVDNFSEDPVSVYADFLRSINTKVDRCGNRRRLPLCSWQNRRRVINTIVTYRLNVTQEICCCACRRVRDCVAVHYSTSSDTCVVHFGGEPEMETEWRRIAWIKT